MSTSFEKYSDILLDAYQNDARAEDASSKKKEIIDKILDHHGSPVDDILFVGFSPGILKLTGYDIFVTMISTDVQNFLTEQKIKFTYVDFNEIVDRKFSAVIAFDEYFTFAQTDSEQREAVEKLISISKNFVATTLRDYKNQDFREKEFSYPVLVKGSENKKIFFEFYEYHQIDKNSSQGTNYILDDESVEIIGPFSRRAMFFKQLAKFSLDAGADSFLIHKNIMYKSLIKRTYEHIITIKTKP